MARCERCTRRVRAGRSGLNAERLSERQVRRAKRLGCTGISARWRSITPDLAARVAEAGMELAAWTVRDRATTARLERLGVVAICVEGEALDG
jgi:glycerophosphoryl diester phosphodiesterase